MQKKIILQLCADTGSDTKPYQDHPDYEVRLIGSEIGVENYHPPANVYGIIANPVCTEFSCAQGFQRIGDHTQGLFLVEHCQRIITEANPKFWIIENPASGKLKEYLGEPAMTYEPWHYGSPWTKKTALWGNFNKPERIYHKWEAVPKLEGLYTRPNRPKPSLAFMHKSHVKFIPEFSCFKPESDMEFRSLCSQKFAQALFSVNR
jgi:hypothetical protein